MSKGNRDKKKRRREKAKRQKRQRASRLAGEALAGDGRQAPSLPGEKLSARLWKLIERYRKEDTEALETYQEVKTLTDTATIAWNISLLPRQEHQDEILKSLDFLRTRDPEMRAVARQMLTEMVERKLSLFPGDKRLVASHTLIDEGGNWRLMVASATTAP